MAKQNAFAVDLLEMMANWNKIVAAVRAAMPNATDEEVYRVAKGAMNKSLGL